MAFLSELKQKIALSVGELSGFTLCFFEHGGAVVEGVKVVISVEAEEICLRAGKAKIYIRGEHLEVFEVNVDEVIIKGDIFNIEVENLSKTAKK